MIEQNDWKQAAIRLAETEVMSWRDIAIQLEAPKSSVSDYLRKYYQFKNEERVESLYYEPPTKDTHDNSRILVISDLHFPYESPDTFDFLQMLKDKYSPTRVIQLGDEVDYHASSFHDSDPDLYSAGHELKKAQQKIKRLEQMFPEMDLLDSNHGSLIYRKAKTHGLPAHCIKSYNEMLGVGEGWKWHNDLMIELPNGQSVYFCHGRSTDGLKLSKNMSCNVVQGHFHSKFNISYWSNPKDLYWSMQAGCLVDNNSLAMAYNKLTLDRPIIGCGLIIEGVPVLEAMPL